MCADVGATVRKTGIGMVRGCVGVLAALTMTAALATSPAAAEEPGRPTHGFGGKIDYLFSSETRRWCVVADSAYSDHHVMIESVGVA